MYNGSNDLFNFKPHEIDLYKLKISLYWPRLAIQLSKEQTKKRPDKIVGTQILMLLSALIVDAD